MTGIDSGGNVSDLVVARNCCISGWNASRRCRVGVGMFRSVRGGKVYFFKAL